MNKLIIIILFSTISLLVFAGGSPEYVAFPENYKTEFTQYDARNRANGKQFAVLYADQTAKGSAQGASLENGSRIIMEIYKITMDTEDKAKTDENGLFEKGALAAIAVMEKNTNWPESYSADLRAGDWGFALYNTDGTPKENDLVCATCHVNLKATDYLYSLEALRKN